MSIIDEIKDSFRKGSTLSKLIYLNLGLFLAVQIVRIVLFLSNAYELFPAFLNYLAVPANLEVLAHRPWTLVTYMFLHVDFIHILFNLLWLYWFGTIFMQELGLKKLLSTYLLGGLAGGILYVVFYNLFPVFESVRDESIALGASASVMAVVVATATYQPERRMHLILIGPVKIIYIALFMFIFTSLVDFSVNTGGKIAHIGGALAGFLFAHYYRRGKDLTRGFDRSMDRVATWFKPGRDNLKVTYKRSADQKPPADDLLYNKQKVEEQKEIDKILDKISKAGYDSLSSREKELLFKMSDKKKS
ncbi:MAG: rhomboid family intramembrane serine protease [Bacteroidales bacterium]|nr:rhomboid family intramembrane serine protease [Bacteroidales bacterium]